MRLTTLYSFCSVFSMKLCQTSIFHQHLDLFCYVGFLVISLQGCCSYVMLVVCCRLWINVSTFFCIYLWWNILCTFLVVDSSCLWFSRYFILRCIDDLFCVRSSVELFFVICWAVNCIEHCNLLNTVLSIVAANVILFARLCVWIKMSSLSVYVVIFSNHFFSIWIYSSCCHWKSSYIWTVGIV